MDRPASGEPEDFKVRGSQGLVSFVVRCGDGSPYTVYLRPEKALELEIALASLRRVGR